MQTGIRRQSSGRERGRSRTSTRRCQRTQRRSNAMERVDGFGSFERERQPMTRLHCWSSPTLIDPAYPSRPSLR